ncbi:MAG: hypothetical protein HYX21_03305 [Candidatus Yanofskybacteria bacterium]|nr:hypothetical protein [Candidatus Yanofskybacteria bacterium]
MEKISLRPNSQEILFKTDESNVYFDSFEYGPHDKKDKHLGYLFVVGHLKYGTENMAYVLNLISSLAKREYYSENGSIAEDPKKAFEMTLKKLNDVLEDFFQNKDLKINLGLVSIAGENIFISKLGKFKILLARSGEMIDILNNVDLFNRETTDERQFSNIVSGKIKEGDKIFATYPSKQITSRDKAIKSHLIQKEQENFVAELASIHQSTKNFPCCGFHIEIKKVKESEIPIRSAYDIVIPKLATGAENKTPESIPNYAKPHTSPAKTDAGGASNQEAETAELKNPASRQNVNTNNESATIISSEMSMVKRKSILSKMREKISRQRLPNNTQTAKLLKTGSIITFVVFLTFGLFKLSSLIPSANKSTLNTAKESVKLAEIKITQNENGSARELLALSLNSLSSIKETNKTVDEIKIKINTLLDKLDLVSSRQPELLVNDLLNKFQKLAVSASGELMAISADQKIYKITPENQVELASSAGMEASFAFLSDKHLSLYNGSNQTGILNLESKKYSTFNLKEPETAKDASLYEGNLYLLTEAAIYKYPDITTGGVQKQLWLGGLTEGNGISIAVDGNIYILQADSTVVKYFKGKEESRINLNLKVSTGSKLLTNKDSNYFYLADFSNKRIRVFDKIAGSLVLTFKITQFDSIKDVALGNKALYLTSGEGQIWKISLE